MEESSGLGYDNKSVRFIFTLFLPGLLTDNMLVWAAPVWAEAKQDNKWKKKKNNQQEQKKHSYQIHNLIRPTQRDNTFNGLTIVSIVEAKATKAAHVGR